NEVLRTHVRAFDPEPAAAISVEHGADDLYERPWRRSGTPGFGFGRKRRGRHDDALTSKVSDRGPRIANVDISDRHVAGSTRRRAVVSRAVDRDSGAASAFDDASPDRRGVHVLEHDAGALGVD